MVNYDMFCSVCEALTVINVKYEDRDKFQQCPVCGQISAKKVYATPPQVRTEKLSRTFVDGTNRFAELKAQAKLQSAIASATSKEERKAAEKELSARIEHNKRKK